MTDSADVSRETRSNPPVAHCDRHSEVALKRNKRGRLYCPTCTYERLHGAQKPRRGAPAAPGTTGSRRLPKGATDYRPGLNGMLQMVCMPLVLAGTAKPPLLADAAAITEYGPPIVEAVNDLAQEDPRLAAVLDRVLGIGPYGALLAAVLPLAAQLLANHKALPLALLKNLGARDPDLLLAKIQHDMEQAARAEAEETAYFAAMAERERAAAANGKAP